MASQAEEVSMKQFLLGALAASLRRKSHHLGLATRRRKASPLGSDALVPKAIEKKRRLRCENSSLE